MASTEELLPEYEAIIVFMMVLMISLTGMFMELLCNKIL